MQPERILRYRNEETQNQMDAWARRDISVHPLLPDGPARIQGEIPIIQLKPLGKGIIE